MFSVYVGIQSEYVGTVVLGLWSTTLYKGDK